MQIGAGRSMKSQLSTHQNIASLPWYDLPEIQTSTDALWSQFSRQFRLAGLTDVPSRLNRAIAYDRQWTSERFLFGQACGYDVRVAFADQLQIVATPCYAAAGCRAAEYSSYVVVHEDAPYKSIEDLRGARCIINTPTSHSGMNVLRALVAPLHCEGRFFASVRLSGSHERSLRKIRRGEVDVAAIDCVTHALLAAYRPQELAKCRVLQRTQKVPGPPYVTSASTPPDVVAAMREAVQRAVDSPALADTKQTLLLSGIQFLSAEAYAPIESLRATANAHNYREIPDHVRVAG